MKFKIGDKVRYISTKISLILDRRTNYYVVKIDEDGDIMLSKSKNGKPIAENYYESSRFALAKKQ